MAEKDGGKPVPEIRISFEIPASSFRVRHREKRHSAEMDATRSGSSPDHSYSFPSKIWEYVVDLTVPECSEYAGIAAGTWTFAVLRRMEHDRDNHQDFEKQVSASLHPQESVFGNWTTSAPDSRGFRMTFFVGFSSRQKSPFTIWKSNGDFHDNKWTCDQARCEFSDSDYHLPHCFDYEEDSMREGTRWSLDMLFDITMPRKRAVGKVAVSGDKFVSLLQLGTFSDCTLNSADGREFPAHRAILSAQSPVLAAMFLSDTTTGICKVTDVGGDLLEAVLEFLYGRSVNEELKLKVEEVLVTAHKYEMDDLQNVCEDVMIAGLNKENAVRYLGLAITYGLDKLMKRAAKFVAES